MQREDIRTKIFIDGGDPEETRQAKEMLGFLDGQTTNPSLIAKNYKRKVGDQKITQEEALQAYKDTVRKMREIIPDGSISIQVFANEETKADEMLEQARDRNSWIPNASIKFPCTTEGLKAAEEACKEMNINITLVFSQAQAAAVYEATKDASHSVFLSPFVGRLDDRGENGMQVVRNILRMFRSEKRKTKNEKLNPNNSPHVQVLTASIRNLDHLLYALQLGSDIATLPFENAFKPWAEEDFTIPDENYVYNAEGLAPIPYDDSIESGQPWQEYDLSHPLTDKGLAAFWQDWQNLFE